MATVGELVINLKGNTAQLNSSLDSSARKVKRFADDGAQGFRKIENAVVDLGLQTVGLDGKWGRLAEGALMFGAGGAVTFAVTGGLLLISGAMSESSKKAREQQEELEKLGKKYTDMARQIKLGARGVMEADLAKFRVALAGQQNPDLNSLGLLGGLKAGFKWFWETRPGGSSKAKSLVEFVAEDASKNRKVIQEQISAIEAVLKDFDQKAAKWVGADFAASNAAALRSLAEDRPRYRDAFVDRGRQAALDRFGALDTSRLSSRITDAAERTARTIEVRLNPAITAVTKKMEFWKDVTVSMAQQSEDAMQRFFFGLQSRGLSSFRSFVSQIIEMWEQMIARIAAHKVAEAIGLQGLVSGVVGAVSGGESHSAGAGVEALGASSNLAVTVNVSAFDARGVREAADWLAPAVANHVLTAVRRNSQYAAALRGA